MAQYQHLPIYKATYELLQQITKVTKDFPRDYKHSLGADPLATRAMANSYFGLMGHANAWRERKRFAAMLRKHGYRVSQDLTRVIL